MFRRLISLLVFTSCIGSFSFAQKSAPKKSTSPIANQEQEQERYSTTLLKNADITIRRLNIPAQSDVPVAATSHDYLVISIGTNSITVRGEKSSFDLTLGPGDMQVIDGGWKHALVNDSNAEAELYAIEPSRNINPKAAICGLGAKICREHRFGETAEGTYNQFVQFETETARLLRLTIAPGVVTHLHADEQKHLIVALTPFRGHNDAEKFDLKAGDMRWISKGFQELGNDGTSEVRVLVLELR